MTTVRIWDLPTRLFHWALAACIVGLVVTAKVGGEAMNWHFRLAYAVFTLLVFRLLWGLVGGHWSRFASFFPTPGRLARHFGGRSTAADSAGHTPLGALSVFAMLGVLALQVLTGLFADDEIAFSGPLTALVSGEWVSRATTWHKGWGQNLVIALVLLHVVTVFVYLARRRNLITPMLTGDKRLAEGAALPAAADSAGRRLLALMLLALSAGVVYAVVQMGAVPTLG